MFGVSSNKEFLFLLSSLLSLPNDLCGCGSRKSSVRVSLTESNDPPNSCACPRAGVVSNSPLSAGIGRDILASGGSAVDAAITTLFCEGVMFPHAMGIGGGFLMTLYDAKNKVVRTLNARETAPGATSEKMFEGHIDLSQKGALSVCVPGEVRGYWYAHQEYGRLPWSDLVKPASIFARCGFKVTPYMELVLAGEEKQLLADNGLRKLYICDATRKPFKAEQIIRNVKLGKTLEKISKYGEKVLYNGELTKDFVEDIQRRQGIISLQDMKDYEPVWENSLSTALLDGCYTFHTMDTPGSGAILILILNMLDNNLDLRNIDTVNNWHKIIEAFKFGNAVRSKLGDARILPKVKDEIQTLISKEYASDMRTKIEHETHSEPKYYTATTYSASDQATSNVVVFAPDGDAVVVTSSINENFGAGILSESTGIILNNAMHAFSLPNTKDEHGLPSSPENYIAPGKRPMSSMAPSLLLDRDDNLVYGVGAAGGPSIPSGIALVTLRHLYFKEPLTKAVAAKRILNQLFPMQDMVEYGFCEAILKGLIRRSHGIDIKIPDGSIAVTAMAKTKKILTGKYDPRRGGQVALM